MMTRNADKHPCSKREQEPVSLCRDTSAQSRAVTSDATGLIRMEDYLELIPADLMNASGAAFYAGRRAFETPSRLYLLDANPGGNSLRQAGETVQWHCNKVLYNEPDNWSAYRDESWEDATPGTGGIQPRVLTLLEDLHLNPGVVPASNLVFLHSPVKTRVHGDFDELAARCWGFHQAVLKRLGTKVILCFGVPTGDWVRMRLDAHELVNALGQDTGGRGSSRAYKNADDLIVVVASHPGRSDWQERGNDPTQLVRAALEQA
jgi:hypothetical protein